MGAWKKLRSWYKQTSEHEYMITWKNMRSWDEQACYFLGSIQQLEQYNKINMQTEEAADSAVLSLSLMVFSAVSDWKYLTKRVGNFIAVVSGVTLWATRGQHLFSWRSNDQAWLSLNDGRNRLSRTMYQVRTLIETDLAFSAKRI